MTDISTTKIRQLDFTLLLVMQALLRHKRTTAVAAELGLSQSAISHALSRLRDLFGEELFVRRPHGLEPTRHALELAPRIDALVRSAQEAMGLRATFDPATAVRAFRLGTSDYLATLLAPPLLRAFERAAPSARFAMHVVRGRDALESLRREEIDVALGRFDRALDGFDVAELFVDRYCIVARAGHPEIGDKISKALFERLNHVTISVAGDYRSFTDEDMRDVGLTRHVVATAPTFSIAFAVAAQTDAIAIAPARLAQAYAKPLKLKIHDLPRALAPIRVVVVRRQAEDAGVDWLIDLVRRCVAS